MASFFCYESPVGWLTLFVGKIAKDNVSVSTVVRRVVASEIDRRRALLNNTSRSEFVALILEQWFAKGCPPVNEPDRMMLVATGQRR